MKQNKIRILTIFGLTSLVLIIFYGCQKDDTVQNIESSNEIQNILSQKLSLNEIPNSNQVSDVLRNISSNFTSNTLQRTIDPDSVSIDVADILFTEYAETHTLTFKLLSNNPEYYIENIVLHYNVETEVYDEYLVQYEVSGDEFLDIHNGEPLKENTTSLITKLDSGTFSDLSNRSGFCTQTCQTFYFNCTAGGNHEVGQECDGDPSQQPFSTTICGTPTCYDTNPSITPGPVGGGGGGGGGTNDDDIITNPNTSEPCEDNSGNVGIADNNGCIVPDDDLGTRRECRKITEFLDDPLNQDFKDKLIELSSQSNLNLNKEKSVSTFENETALDERIGTDTFPSVAIQSNPTNKYKAFVHTHPNIPPGTLSIFSPADLIEIARIINNDKITGSFVAFLTTKKGTQYAITIQNPTKFVDFFYSQLFDNVSSAIATDPINALAISDRFYNSLNAFTPVYNDYFNPNLNPKIKRTDTENEEVLKEFLNFMDEANAGFTLFDASPITTGGQPFQSFRKIVLRNGEPLRKEPCN